MWTKLPIHKHCNLHVGCIKASPLRSSVALNSQQTLAVLLRSLFGLSASKFTANCCRAVHQQPPLLRVLWLSPNLATLSPVLLFWLSAYLQKFQEKILLYDSKMTAWPRNSAADLKKCHKSHIGAGSPVLPPCWALLPCTKESSCPCLQSWEASLNLWNFPSKWECIWYAWWVPGPAWEFTLRMWFKNEPGHTRKTNHVQALSPLISALTPWRERGSRLGSASGWWFNLSCLHQVASITARWAAMVGSALSILTLWYEGNTSPEMMEASHLKPSWTSPNVSLLLAGSKVYAFAIKILIIR